MLKLLLRGILFVWAIAVTYPLFWTVSTSLKSTQQFNMDDPWSLPKWPLQLVNFADAWNKSHFGDYFLNSVIVVVAAVILSLLMSATTSFMIARHPFRGSKLLFVFYISTMMVPTILSLIPLFFTLSSVGLTDSLTGLTLVYAVMQVPFGIFVLTGFFKALPRELEEAATIDGCGLFSSFFVILLPLARSGLVTVGIMNALTYWNEYVISLILISSPGKYTVSLGLAFLQGEMQYSVDWGILFAGLVISVIPVFLVYILFQKYITEGLISGALKG
ncbi:carbohydrate ABC transporter permease [Paenibacillus solisilvae]|uniref:Carbohydrate ABC transporter permease n=1 Tax=Paenibacillus solisilvae TaxID=2486751 RepID=A0ABW0W273_9BACL